MKTKFKIDRKEVLSWNPYLKNKASREVSPEEAEEFLVKKYHLTKEEARKKANTPVTWLDGYKK